MLEVCQEASYNVENACTVENEGDKSVTVQKANDNLMDVLTQKNVIQRLEKWKTQKSRNAMFLSLMNYLHRVETILYL